MFGDFTIHFGVNNSRKTEIADLRSAIVKQDVCWLDISMDDFHLVENLEPFDDVLEENHGFELWDWNRIYN
jgi:hypothetical protein